MKKTKFFCLAVMVMMFCVMISTSFAANVAKNSTCSVSASRTHEWTLNKTVAATCTTAGYRQYICIYCSNTYNETTTPAKGHTVGTWYKTSAGHYQWCTVCNTQQNFSTHNQANVKTVAATCTTAGSTTTSCSVCGYVHSTTTIPAKGHTLSGWQKVSAGHYQWCTTCNTQQNFSAHNQDNVKTVAATCTTAGSTTTSCSVCGYVHSTTTIPAKGHTLSGWQKVSAGHYQWCTSCNTQQNFSAHNKNNVKTIAATCTKEGSTTTSCSVCGYVHSTTTIPKKAHTWGNWASKNSTTHVRYCTVCGTSEQGSHDKSVLKHIKLPTATTDGEDAYYCGVCGAKVETVVVKATGSGSGDGSGTETSPGNPSGETPSSEIGTPVEFYTTTLDVKLNGRSISAGKTVEAETGSVIRMEPAPASKVKFIYYAWDDGTKIKLDKSPSSITIPTTFQSGTLHKLCISVEYINGQKIENQLYYFSIAKEETTTPSQPSELTTPTDDPKNPEHDDLEVLPWEVENISNDNVAISLRNDSMADKANKNLYALNETVTYYIDFENAGEAIREEVLIQLHLPINFKTLDSAQGTVDAKNKVITWKFPLGLKAKESGTFKVMLQYTALSNTNLRAETIYPNATISSKTKQWDISSVIHYIYLSTDTIMDTVHQPYMYGDANATTFRPDYTITRAEGALVLVRILLGQDVINRTTIEPVFPDLNETYLEAQRAIVAAQKYGIIQGYTDGTYKPNRRMTRAEFMKILARFIEINAKKNGIEGLNVKGNDLAIKLYSNPVNAYSVYGRPIVEHWAIGEITLLARLNMTSLSIQETDMRMDEEISRAEVAQLVNFYLLRAPAQLNSHTITGFSDVSIYHKLVADIIEATRATHEYTITSDGREIAK